MKHGPKAFTAAAIAVAVGAAIATLVSLLRPARGGNWGTDVYVMAPLPYVVLVILALGFRRTLPGALISLIGTVVLAGWGVYWSYGWRDAIEVVLLPYTLLAGCGVVLLAQLIRWAIMRRTRG